MRDIVVWGIKLTKTQVYSVEFLKKNETSKQEEKRSNIPTSWYVGHLHPVTQKDGYRRHMDQVHANLLEDGKAFIPE